MKPALLALLGVVALQAQFLRPDYAIVNAHIAVSAEKIIPAGTILIRNGLIASVGTEAPPPEALVIDAKGLTVYPGLIDAASHYGFPSAARPPSAPSAAQQVPDDIASPVRYLRPEPSGVNAAISAASRLEVPAQPDARRALGFTATLSIPREGLWQGRSALVQLGAGPAAGAVIDAAVAMHVNLPQAAVYGSAARYPTSLMGAFAVLRQSLLRARQYREALQIYEKNGRRGLARPVFDPVSEALQPVLDGKLPVVFNAGSAEQIRRVIRFSGEFDLRPIILGGAEAWRVAGLLKEKGIPVLLDASLDPPGGTLVPPNSSDRLAAEMNPGKLEKAGVRFAFVTAGSSRPERFRERISVAIRRGLSREAAIRALTTGPAEILGASAQLGTIEPGRIANLTLVEGDYLDPKAAVRATLIDGRFYPSAAAAPGAGRPAVQTAAAPPAPPQTPDDPAPVTPRAATPPDVSPSPLPSRRPPAPEPAPRDLVIRNATILTVTKGTLSNASLWLHEGKIRELGASVAAPAGAKVIDGSGLFVMPGIIDSHSHTAISGGVNETGASVTAMTRVADVLDPESINLYRAAAGGVTTLNILHGSANVIGGQNAVVKVKWGAPVEQMLFPGAPAGIKLALGENPKRTGATNAGRFPATRMGVENVLRESFRAAREYARRWDEYRARAQRGEPAMPPERNLSLDALAGVLSGKILVHAHCYRADEISMLLDMADEFGFRIRSLQHVLEGYKVTEKIRKHGAGASTFADHWGYKMEALDGTAYNAALMMKAGIRTAINSDSSERARRLYNEAAKAVKYGGLTEDQALRTITADPAWMLGVENRVGAIEPGMDADVAVFSAHPLSAYARVEMTIVDGQIVFDRKRDLESRIPWKEEFEPESAVSTATGADEEEVH